MGSCAKTVIPTMSQIYLNIPGVGNNRRTVLSGFSDKSSVYYSDPDSSVSGKSYNTDVSSDYSSQRGIQGSQGSNGDKKSHDKLSLLWVIAAGVALVVLVAFFAVSQNQIMIVEERLRELEEKIDAQNSFDIDESSSGGFKIFGRNAYRFVNEEKSHNEAEAFCQSHGMQLASIQTKAENEFLVRQGNGEAFRISGIQDQTDASKWKWGQGGVPWDTHGEGDAIWRNWAPNQPDNGDRIENCMVLENRKSVQGESRVPGKWYDVVCSAKLRSICKGPILYAVKHRNLVLKF